MNFKCSEEKCSCVLQGLDEKTTHFSVSEQLNLSLDCLNLFLFFFTKFKTEIWLRTRGNKLRWIIFLPIRGWKQHPWQLINPLKWPIHSKSSGTKCPHVWISLAWTLPIIQCYTDTDPVWTSASGWVSVNWRVRTIVSRKEHLKVRLIQLRWFSSILTGGDCPSVWVEKSETNAIRMEAQQRAPPGFCLNVKKTRQTWKPTTPVRLWTIWFECSLTARMSSCDPLSYWI